MGIHAKDRMANNPRLQCDACGKWMRLHRRSEHPAHPGWTQNFYGGCQHTHGDHPAGIDVCVDCCDTKCKELANQLPKETI